MRRKQLTQYIDPSFLKRERKASESLNLSGNHNQISKKRSSTDLAVTGDKQQANKKNRMHHESVSPNHNVDC